MSRLRLGFLGVGWIGRHRMAAMLATGLADAVAVADASPDALAEALSLAPTAHAVPSLDAMLELAPDGVVIATPSALHADQAIRALDAGAAVFCQKPLGRHARETRAVVESARRADRLLAVDFSYRFAVAVEAIVAPLRAGELGRIQAVDLVFHNAYGPDKPWFYNRAQSGGGCVIDLGVHLVDLALWALGFPDVAHVSSALFAGGAPLAGSAQAVEDLALATLTLGDGAIVRLGCSWRLHAGQDAVIEARFYGSEGGAAMRNLDGSFYDFAAERYRGTERRTLSTPPDAWGGRAAANWVGELAQSRAFDPSAAELVRVAEVIDRIYAAAGGAS